MGYGKRITTAAAIAAVVRIAGVGMQAIADDNVWLNLLQYAVPVGAIAWAMTRVFRQNVRHAVRQRAHASLNPAPRPA